MDQVLAILDILGKLALSPLGQAVLGVIAIAVVFLVFSLARAVLGLLKKHAAGTPTPVDDAAVDAAAKAVDEAETNAKSFIVKVFGLGKK